MSPLPPPGWLHWHNYCHVALKLPLAQLTLGDLPTLPPGLLADEVSSSCMMPPIAFPWLLSLLFLEPNFLASTLWASLHLAQGSQRQEHMKREKSIQKPNGYQYFEPILRIKITMAWSLRTHRWMTLGPHLRPIRPAPHCRSVSTADR